MSHVFPVVSDHSSELDSFNDTGDLKKMCKNSFFVVNPGH